jgi:hypothetical protein
MKAIAKLPHRFLETFTTNLGILLFSIAVLVRIAVIVHFRPYTDLTRYELERTAISLARTGIYGNPYAIPTGPTAHVSPGYTLILAALFHLFGTGTTAEIFKELLATCVTALQIALLPLIAAFLSLDRRAGFLAGLVMAVYPARPMVEIDGDWEAPYIALALMLAAVLAAYVWKNRYLKLSVAVVHGPLWGIALLFVSPILPLFLVFVILGAIWRRRELKSYLAFAAIEVIVAAACLSPWIIRNQITLGAPVITRTNSGIELRISNNDFAVADQRENAVHGLFERYHPLQSPAEAFKIRQLGEVEYNRRAMQQAKEWIREHPKRFLQLTLGRIRCFWFYVDPTSRLKTSFVWIVNVFGFAALILALSKKHMADVILAVVALLYPLPNYLVHVGLRQSYPVEWLMLLLGCALITGALNQRSAPVPKDGRGSLSYPTATSSCASSRAGCS